MRFSEEEKLTIIAEGEKNGVRAVCAKYGISDDTYRRWRYKALGIRPKRHFSLEKRLRVLKEGQKRQLQKPSALGMGSAMRPIGGGAIKSSESNPNESKPSDPSR
jgi:transposase-like protein